jgi:hypothetical protein
MHSRSGAIISILSVGFCFASPVHAQSDTRAILLDGVREIAAPGLPGSVAVYGKNAVPIVVGKAGRGYREAVVAAAEFGKGRVIAFGHTGYLDAETLKQNDSGRLLVNAVRWAGRKPTPRVAVLGNASARTYLTEQGFTVEALPVRGSSARLKDFDVVVGTFSDVPAAEQAAYAAFLRDGGGLIGAETGWGWQQIRGGNAPLAENGGNRIVAGCGVMWAGGTPDKTTRQGYAADTAEAVALVNAGGALDTLERSRNGGTSAASSAETAQAVWTISQVAQVLPANDTVLLPLLNDLKRNHRVDFSQIGKQPVTMAMPLDRLVMTLDIREAMSAPADKVKAHPSAASFPGAIPSGAARISRTVNINTAIPGWAGTGLYAAPGEVITVTVPAEAAKRGLSLRIGAHSDRLWHLAEWKRAPEVTRNFTISTQTVRAANAFGGAVFIEVPANSRLGTIPVQITNAVPAPRFVRGETSLEEWRRAIRNYPAPWAEMEGKRCILTVPSSAIRTLDDPEALMAYWDETMDHCADLYAIPRARLRPERYCVDRQISAGYMHSGYPIMTGDDVAKAFCDLSLLRGKDGQKVWGFYHEVGHNHQIGDWTWDGCGEVTNNFFSLYGVEMLNGVGPSYINSHPAIRPETRLMRLSQYLANGPDYEKWKSDPFLALTMFIQLRQAFGWEPFKQVFAQYRTLSSEERPKDDIEKRSQFMVRFSRAVGKNLGPFFTAWGVPTSADARKLVADLPAWMPDEMRRP